tara:strand:+ start:1660 stop:3051 length:1392 start_codon:yes stop_codon:yes gene_type:complete
MVSLIKGSIKNWFSQLMTKFPLATSASLLWCISLILNLFSQIELKQLILLTTKTEFFLHFLSRICILCIPLFLICSLLIRVYKSKVQKLIIYITTNIIIIWYTLDNLIWKNWQTDQLQINQEFFIILTILILSVTFIPFIQDSIRGFWVANNILFIKLLKVITYCLVLLMMLNITLLFIDFIIQIKIDFWVYQLGFILICCGFGPLYFLAQIPNFKTNPDEDVAFPKFYILFTSIYLLPLSVISIGGMYGYIISLLITKSLPTMEIQILFVVVASIIIFLMFQFELLSTKFKSKLITIFLRYIYISILPLATLFILQLSYYLFNKGITEFWYLMWIYIGWIIGVCLYFIKSQKRDIRIIPISLCITLLVLLIGPLKPYNISVNSQYKQLINILVQQEIINENKKIFLAKKHVIKSNEKEIIKDKIYFLESHNKLDLLQKHYPYPIDKQAITMQRIIQDLGLDI